MLREYIEPVVMAVSAWFVVGLERVDKTYSPTAKYYSILPFRAWC